MAVNEARDFEAQSASIHHKKCSTLGVDRLSAPILSIFPIIDIGHFKNRFADNFFLLCKQTYYLQVTLFIGE